MSPAFQSTHSESEWPLPVNWELKLKIGHVMKALRNRGCPHTQRPYVAKIYIIRCFQQRWFWKNCSRELQNDSMAKVWETNQEGITKMSQHRGKKCNDKIASPWRYRGQNGQQQYLLALVKCLIDVRFGKTFSVHRRRPAASSYWKSNWSDTCIFELNEPGFSIPSFWVGVIPQRRNL